MSDWTIRLLETPAEMTAVEELQRLVWPGSETEVVPAHMLSAACHNGGLALGAFSGSELIGVVFGFPGLYPTPDGPRLKHHSHLLGIRPDWRDRGLGVALKRAQWQIVRKQGIDRITWTYDPLLSRNAYLNIGRLGAVCNTYLRSFYGEMRDSLNAGLPTDRLQVDWWLNTKRVEHRLSRRARPRLSLEQYRAAGVLELAASRNSGAAPRPVETLPQLTGPLLLVEIPADFQSLRQADLGLARDWRFFGREAFETAFQQGYLVTDFVHAGSQSYYVLTHGDSSL